MWPDRVSNPGPPTYESDALPIALRGPANMSVLIRLRPMYMYLCNLFEEKGLVIAFPELITRSQILFFIQSKT